MIIGNHTASSLGITLSVVCVKTAEPPIIK
jgi:hypothetical protein